MQIIINEKFITPLIEKNITNVNYYELKLNKHHTTIFFKDNKIHELHFSIPFGQAYFFLMFFLWFKPYGLTKAISFYNLILIPIYSLAVILFLQGYFIFGKIVMFNEDIYRLTYSLILFLKITRPTQFSLIFNHSKK